MAGQAARRPPAFDLSELVVLTAMCFSPVGCMAIMLWAMRPPQKEQADG